MSHTTWILRLGVLAVVGAASGCGDSFPKIVQAELAIINELSDSLSKVVDEASAGDFQETVFPRLKDARETVRNRKEKYLKAHLEDDRYDFQWAMAEIRAPREGGGDPYLAADKDAAEDFKAALEELQSKYTKLAGADPKPKNQNELNSMMGKCKRASKYVDEFRVEYTKSFRDEYCAANARFWAELDRIQAVVDSDNRANERPNLAKLRAEVPKTFTPTIGLITEHLVSAEPSLDEKGNEYVFTVTPSKTLKSVVAKVKWLGKPEGKDPPDSNDPLTFSVPNEPAPTRIRVEGSGWVKTNHYTFHARAKNPKKPKD